MKNIYLTLIILLVFLILFTMVSSALISEKPRFIVIKSVEIFQNTIGYNQEILIGDISISKPSDWIVYTEKENDQLLKFGFIPVEFEDDSDDLNIISSSREYISYMKTDSNVDIQVDFAILRGNLKAKFNDMSSRHSQVDSRANDDCINDYDYIGFHKIFKNWKGNKEGSKMYYLASKALLIMTADEYLCEFEF